jgi:hypothetical protein
MYMVRTFSHSILAAHPVRGMLLFFVLAAACSSPSEPIVEAPLVTDRDNYVATSLSEPGTVVQYGCTVIVRVRNTRTAPLHLDTCGGSQTVPFDVELVAPQDPAGAAYNRAWSCPAGAAHVLEPGQERTDTLQLRGPVAIQSA